MFHIISVALLSVGPSWLNHELEFMDTILNIVSAVVCFLGPGWLVMGWSLLTSVWMAVSVLSVPHCTLVGLAGPCKPPKNLK